MSPDWIAAFHVLRPRNRQDDVVLALTTTGTVKVWTLNGQEEKAPGPVLENESKQLRSIIITFSLYLMQRSILSRILCLDPLFNFFQQWVRVVIVVGGSNCWSCAEWFLVLEWRYRTYPKYSEAVRKVSSSTVADNYFILLWLTGSAQMYRYGAENLLFGKSLLFRHVNG